MVENKKTSTKWLRFLYVFFVVQCVIFPFSLFGAYANITRYVYEYGSAYVLNGFFYFSLALTILRFIIKVAACIKKYTETGYGLFIATLCIDSIFVAINGFGTSVEVGFFTTIIGIAILIPNIIYITKRKHLYKRSSNTTQSLRIVRCGNCNTIVPVDKSCPVCGSSTKIYSYEAIQNSAASKNDDIKSNLHVGRQIQNDIENQQQEIITHVETIQKPLFCRKCGAKLLEGSVFCNKCGTKTGGN